MRASLEKLIDGMKFQYHMHTWAKYYAWRPVKDVHGTWHWLKPMRRLMGNTYVDHDDWSWYFYLTEEDYTMFLLRYT